MRYCTNCGRFTGGEPLFCNHCGSSYDVKLCPSRHPNPRNAEVCSQCGAREFSQPAPPPSGLVDAVHLLVTVGLPVALVAVSLAVLAGIINALLTNAQVQAFLVCTVLYLAFIWWIYVQVAEFLSGIFGRIKHPFKKRGGS